MAAPSNTFDRVLKDFKSKLSPQDEADFSETTLEDLQVAILRIQKKQASTRTMQNLNRLKGFLEAMQTYYPVIDLFVNVNNFVAFIWGPVKCLLIVSSTFADAFNALLDAYQRITETLPTMAQYQALFDTDSRMQQALGTIFEDIFEFHVRALRYFKGNVWKHVFQATWKHFDTKFKGLLDNMQHHKHLVETQASLLEFREAKRAREIAEKAFDEQEQHEILRRRTYLLSWLSAADVHSDQLKGHEARQANPQSGQWLLAKDLFRSWFDPQSVSTPLLWITGIPGAGKTVLASLIIEEVEGLQDANALYFYYRNNDQQRNSFVAMARSLLQQVLHLNNSLVRYLFEAAATSEEASLNTGKVAKRLLDVCLKSLSTVYIILDGLDECPEREQRHITKWVQEFVNSSASASQPARFVFLSQVDASTRQQLSKLPTIHISSKDNSSDIESFCLLWARRLQTKFHITEEEVLDITSNATNLANGMFLYAKLVMANLYDQTRRSRLYAELHPDVFPRGLDAAYDRILTRILDDAPASERDDAQKLLGWLVCAIRPLKWREIQAAVSLNSEQQTVDYDQHRLLVDAKHLCGSLIEEYPDGDITLVHSTAKMYLIHKERIRPESEHLKLADLCLEYLCFPFFDDGIELCQTDEWLRTGSYAFMDYAIMAWTKHLEDGLKAAPDSALLREVEATLESFFIVHWRTPKKRPRPHKHMENAVKFFEDTDLQSKALQSMASMHALSSALAADVKSESTTDLFDVVYRVRERLETLAMERNSLSVLTAYYGDQLFKCQRTYCKWFYLGFDSRTRREAHVQRHERSHCCSFAGCAFATLGFATKRELEEHVVAYHKPDPTEDDFPDMTESRQDEAGLKAKQGTKRVGEHLCSVCSKGFSKASNLRAHLRTHNNERAFACSLCDKAFSRAIDKVRHEKLHSGERDFVCSKESCQGTELGCGKRFSRRDQLLRHLVSKGGQACRQAMLDDEITKEVAKNLKNISDDSCLPSIQNVHRELSDLSGLSAQHVRLVQHADTEDASSTYANPFTRPKLSASISYNRSLFGQQPQTVDAEMLLKASSPGEHMESTGAAHEEEQVESDASASDSDCSVDQLQHEESDGEMRPANPQMALQYSSKHVVYSRARGMEALSGESR